MSYVSECNDSSFILQKNDYVYWVESQNLMIAVFAP